MHGKTLSDPNGRDPPVDSMSLGVTLAPACQALGSSSPLVWQLTVLRTSQYPRLLLHALTPASRPACHLPSNPSVSSARAGSWTGAPAWLTYKQGAGLPDPQAECPPVPSHPPGSCVCPSLVPLVVFAPLFLLACVKPENPFPIAFKINGRKAGPGPLGPHHAPQPDLLPPASTR